MAIFNETLRDKFLRHALWMFFTNVGTGEDEVTEDQILELLENMDDLSTDYAPAQITEVYQDYPANVLWEIITDTANWFMRMHPAYRTTAAAPEAQDADVVLDLNGKAMRAITVTVTDQDTDSVECSYVFADHRDAIKATVDLIELYIPDLFKELDALPHGIKNQVRTTLYECGRENTRQPSAMPLWNAEFRHDDSLYMVTVVESDIDQKSFYRFGETA